MSVRKTIFLASSSELFEERRAIEIFLARENKKFYSQGLYLELVIWEDFIDHMSQTRLQDEYNKLIQESDIFLALFNTKVGMYTEEEFDVAFGSFKKENKPLIYTYFNNDQTNIQTHVVQASLERFKKKLDDLGHFYSTFRNIDELKNKLKDQLDKLVLNGFLITKDELIEQDKKSIEISQLNFGNGDNIVGNKTINNFYGFNIGTVHNVSVFLMISLVLFIGMNSFYGFIPRLGIINILVLFPIITLLFILLNKKKYLKIKSALLTLLVFIIGSAPYISQQVLANNYVQKGKKAVIQGFAGRSNTSYKNATHIYDKIGPQKKYISSKIRLAESYFEIGKISMTRKIINELSEIKNIPEEEQADLFGLKGNILFQVGDLTGAEHQFQLALQNEKISNKTKATLLLNKALVVHQKGPNYFHEATTLIESAINLHKEMSDYYGISTSFLNMASLFENDPIKSQMFLDSAEHFSHKVDSKELTAYINMNSGLINRRKGNYNLASEKYILAQKAYAEIGHIGGQADILLKRAYLDIAGNSTKSALDKIMDAHNWLDQYDTQEYNPIRKAELLSAQAGLLEGFGRIDEANQLYIDAINILKENRSLNTELSVKLNYASFLQNNNKIKELLPLQNEIRNIIFNDYKGQANGLVMAAINNLAKSYQDQNEFDLAKSLYTQALEIAIKIEDILAEAGARENLSIIMNWMNQDGWKHQIDAALNIYKESNNKSLILNCLFNIYVTTGESELLDSIIIYLKEPTLDLKTKIDIVLGLSPLDISNLKHLQQFKKIITKNLNLEMVLQNDYYLAKSHLRLALIEQKMGNYHKIAQHLPIISSKIDAFPYPKNKVAISELAFLYYLSGNVISCVDNFFIVFDLNEGNTIEQSKFLNINSKIWNELTHQEQTLYINKLKILFSSSSDPEYKEMINTFLNQINVNTFHK